MRASTICRTLIAALGLSVAGCTALKNSGGGELRGTPNNIDVAHNAITMDGVTIQGGQYPLANLTFGQVLRIVHYQKQGDVNVLTDIEPDESDGRTTPRSGSGLGRAPLTAGCPRCRRLGCAPAERRTGKGDLLVHALRHHDVDRGSRSSQGAAAALATSRAQARPRSAGFAPVGRGVAACEKRERQGW